MVSKKQLPTWEGKSSPRSIGTLNNRALARSPDYPGKKGVSATNVLDGISLNQIEISGEP